MEKINPLGVHFQEASLAKLRLSTPDAQQIKDFMSNCLRKEKFFLVISGPPGTGKTYIAAALYPWIRKTFSSYRFHKDSEIFDRLRGEIQQNHEWGDALRQMTDDQMVVWDDFGRSTPNDWRKDVYFNFIDYRYSSNLPTILTTNYSKKEIEEDFNAALASRVFGRKNSCVIDLREVSDMRDYEIIDGKMKQRTEFTLADILNGPESHKNE